MNRQSTSDSSQNSEEQNLGLVDNDFSVTAAEESHNEKQCCCGGVCQVFWKPSRTTAVSPYQL